jgi:hypothetical protein
MAKETYKWNPEKNEWDLSIDYDSEETKEISRLEKQMIDSGEDACKQFEHSWNEIFLLKATSEATDFQTSDIIAGGIKFAEA